MSPVDRQRLPRTLAISGGRPPEIANVLGPEPRFRRSPFADAENDRAPGLGQSVAHDGIGCDRVLRRGVAPVVLQIVDAPGRVLARILKLIAAAARTILAGAGAGV